MSEKREEKRRKVMDLVFVAMVLKHKCGTAVIPLSPGEKKRQERTRERERERERWDSLAEGTRWSTKTNAKCFISLHPLSLLAPLSLYLSISRPSLFLFLSLSLPSLFLILSLSHFITIMYKVMRVNPILGFLNWILSQKEQKATAQLIWNHDRAFETKQYIFLWQPFHYEAIE